jgi:hypothetical protein
MSASASISTSKSGSISRHLDHGRWADVGEAFVHCAADVLPCAMSVAKMRVRTTPAARQPP